MKKILTLAIALLLLFTSVTVFADGSLPDDPVSDDWKIPYTDVPVVPTNFPEKVKWATVNGIMNGTTPTTFEPNTIITRAMFVTMLYRYDKPEKSAYAVRFADVPADAWYAEGVAWAAANVYLWNLRMKKILLLGH